MRRTFSVGDLVELTASCKAQCSEPERYSVGLVTGTGSWGIVDVRWNGIDHAIGMRSDEIQLVESEVLVVERFELVVVWSDGNRDVYGYEDRESAEKSGDGMRMVFGNQIVWYGVRRKI